MTFEEAQNYRHQHYKYNHDFKAYTILYHEIVNYVIIAPELEKDLKSFYDAFNHKFDLYNDELCKNHSSNDRHKIRFLVSTIS